MATAVSYESLHWRPPAPGAVRDLYGDRPVPEPERFHPGLVFDRLLPIPYLTAEYKSVERLAFAKSEAAGRKVDGLKGKWLFDFVDRANAYYRSAVTPPLAAHHARADALLTSVPSVRFDASPAWRWVTGLGNETPLETGLTLHRPLGVPYLPGSALKGLTRAWATLTAEEIATDPAILEEFRGEAAPPTAEMLDAVFGPEEEPTPPRSENGEWRRTGSVVFHDALPRPGSGFGLAVDVMTPHFPKYYADATGAIAPLEIEDPVPVPFLVASGGTYAVALTARTAAGTALLPSAAAWCRSALEDLGAGGKTAKGYGYFLISEAEGAAR
ncbi:type III-B CRISPR module RAMP protein Cmr6 [Alienimonas californiensis]|uniref:CRISPR type III-associated protein domain-containing protein n=1 Tax=Alienimonas californiensis TaxID=2527989 RepID=A0A517P6N8_9PLAN|nr:type III-B CRISPR module RAMP protein Cmr6 [Alienimonas californiensis]QDT15050.1 hypothetical protein CA12_11300 [Alienimonas californiensis]